MGLTNAFSRLVGVRSNGFDEVGVDFWVRRSRSRFLGSLSLLSLSLSMHLSSFFLSLSLSFACDSEMV